MRLAVLRISVPVAAILVLAACGSTTSPSASVEASPTTEPASGPPDVAVVGCTPTPKPFDPGNIDLTGAWAVDDGGIYYLRQVGSVLWWNGMSERDGSPLAIGRDWNNVGRGEIDGLQIHVEWSDVPRGVIYGEGTLELTIQDDGTGNTQIVKVGESEGGFGNSVWTPCSEVELQVADYMETYGGEASQYGVILTLRSCDDLADLENSVTTTLNTTDAGSPEFRAALGYSHAISERQLALDC